MQAIEEGYVGQLCMRGNILVDACIGKPLAPDVTEDVATMALHLVFKSPVQSGFFAPFGRTATITGCLLW